MVEIKNALPVGARLNKYTIEKVLGAGGFAITYKAFCYQGNIRQNYAIKEYFPSDWCERKGERMTYPASVKDEVKNGLESFVTEAKRLSHPKLRHDNLVGVNEIFRANETAYYVMEFIDGGNLYKYVRDYIHIYGHPLPENEAKAILLPVLVAISVLHRNFVAHLDIKPDNIMLEPDKQDGVFRPVVIDLGLSRHYDEKGRVTTKIKSLACTPGYAPNELYQEEGIRNFTPQSDVYSLGATFYFMLTGKTPEVAGTISQSKIREALRSVSGEGVSEQTQTAIINAMKSHKEERTQSVKAFVEDLNLDLEQAEESGIPTVPIRLGGESLRKRIEKIVRSGKLWWIVCVVLLMLVIVYGLRYQEKKNTVADEVKTEINSQPMDSITPLPAAVTEEEDGNDLGKEDETGQTVSEEKIEIQSEDPERIPEKPSVSTVVSQVTEGELDLGYAVWKGGVKNRKPHGEGVMHFKVTHTVEGVEVHNGYRMEGQYENGTLVIGNFYDADGVNFETKVP